MQFTEIDFGEIDFGEFDYMHFSYKKQVFLWEPSGSDLLIGQNLPLSRSKKRVGLRVYIVISYCSAGKNPSSCAICASCSPVPILIQ